MATSKNCDQETLDEDLLDKSDHFKILISPIQTDLIRILKDKLFDKLKDCFYLCEMVISSNNEKSVVQPHSLIELDSIRIFLQTRQVFPNAIVHELIQSFLQEFFRLFVDKHSFRHIIPFTTVFKLSRKNAMNLVQWATFGGDHAPRFSPGITPDCFSENYKIHCWAERNIDKKFDTLDAFVIDKSEKKQKCLRRYLDKYKFTKNFNDFE